MVSKAFSMQATTTDPNRSIRLTVPNPMNERETERLNALYRAEASLVDNWIGQLLRKIDYMGLMENTMVIFMAGSRFSIG